MGCILALASCSKEVISAPENGLTKFTAVAEGIGTKAEMAYCYETRWQSEDEILVRDGDGNEAAFVLTDGAGTTVGTFGKKSGSDVSGTVDAFYPASVGESMEWPSQQTNGQVCPMYATQSVSSQEGTFRFSSPGAMLQIVFSTASKGIVLKSITIKDAEKPLSGAFTIDENGMAVISDGAENNGITLDLGTGVALGVSAKYFNIAIPAGEYDNLTLIFTATNGKVCRMTSTTFPEVEVNTVGRLTLSGEFKSVAPEGALSGKFSISSTGRQVYFSKGNLQACFNGSDYDFGFAANQYDFIGRAEGNITIDSQTEGSVVDLFGWSTASTNYGISSSSEDADYTGSFVDWGWAIDRNKTWFTLSRSEWCYLLGKSAERNGKYRNWVRVCGIKGLVIAPDDFTGTIAESYDAAAWETAEMSGLVFLPAAGMRYSMSGSIHIGNDQRYGYYWSGTPDETGGAAYYSCFFSTEYGAGIEPANCDNCSTGRSVRLVSAVDNSGKDKGLLPGLFTVNSTGRQVGFSQGNLQATYNGRDYDFGFAANQYDYVGDAAGNTTIDTDLHIQTMGAVVDLFGWSTAATNFGINSSMENTDYTGKFVDWGCAIDQNESWRTLSKDEWTYLITGPEREGKYRYMVKVAGVKGLVLAPDAFTGTIAESYDAAAWKSAEKDGLVFLPAAGMRTESSGGAYVGNLQRMGYYWSGTSFERDELGAYFLIFRSTEYGDGIDPASEDNRATGRSVRLVRDIW